MLHLEHTLHLFISTEKSPACTATRVDKILEDSVWKIQYVCHNRQYVCNTQAPNSQHPMYANHLWYIQDQKHKNVMLITEKRRKKKHRGELQRSTVISVW